MSYLSLGLNLPAMFLMNPLCVFKKVAVSQSPQAAYDALLVRLHSNQKLITGTSFSTEEMSIASPVQRELAICAAALTTINADESMPTHSIESTWSFDVSATDSPVLSLASMSRDSTTSFGRTNESELSFCSEAEGQTHPDESFQHQSDHSCLDLSFDVEASFGDRHTSVHFDKEFDFETSFQAENYSSINEYCLPEHSLQLQSVCLQTSSSTIANFSQNEIPHLQIYNQMLEDLLGFSPIDSSEPPQMSSSSRLPSSLTSATPKICDSIDSVSQENIESHLENFIRSFCSRSELSFGDHNDHFDLDLSIEGEESFGDLNLSVHMDNEFNVELSFGGKFHYNLEESFYVHEAIDSSITAPSPAEPLAEGETPQLEIYNQMLQELLGCSDLNSLDSTSTPPTTSTRLIPSTANKTFIKPRHCRSDSSDLETLCSSRSVSFKSPPPKFVTCDSCGPSPDPEKPTNFLQSPLDLLEKPFNSILITDELIEVETQHFAHADQSLDIDTFLRLMDLDHSFGLEINLDLETY
ncbi:uncharacterized protein MELLADRAFT_113781 [Melampsora larici-populina 98AG31]|uniref:Uncharacterized protein n=1 Tax=Melampsora larici-populina (strain 98AG31 / pathotype 3-4-7) TaxID=747676 RepID=F4SB17_MELLP|nr:uncharacterized protein MELLADRAFT_113781 [Melampsora larici-populina 98AG31]EGF98153.1 hypothetical protein MELLADRAFT_113781 [Melampsora larici-populina 98AG31]